MAVTIVDSLATLVALLDCLKDIPTQPPSLYLDLEGVRLSRYGSISIMQICVLPMNHVFLVDIHVLQGKAFSIPNRYGTTLRSVLESELVPKVFFDVRNDADALFAHFRISMQGVHDIQLLEVASRSYPRERVIGLGQCIEDDLKLATAAKEAWKATKQRGYALFATEHGGSYKIFNVRPMQQEIVDYSTNDVVYLPLLWNMYTRKLSAEWAAKVQEETRRRLLMSQAISYNPHGKDKTSSPWASPVKYNRRNHTRNKGELSMGNTNKHESAAERVAKNAAQIKAGKQPEARLGPKLSPSLILGELHPQCPVEKTGLQATDNISDVYKISVNPPSLSHIPVRSRPASHQKILTTLNSLPHPPTTPSKWTCTVCSREMHASSRQEHLGGKPHIARLKQAQDTISEAPLQTATAEKTSQAAAITATSSQKARTELKAKRRPAKSQPAKPQPPKSGKAKGILGSSRSRVPTASPFQQVRTLGSPDCGFIGFDQGSTSQSFPRGRGSSGKDEHYEIDIYECEDYSICDKDCGWCGHCMDGVDV
jgi:exonuclease 3'-5' domain-containing protein 1